LGVLTGEADFIVIAPGKGILIIEAKSPKWAEYKDGDWYLDRVPSPTKSPPKQLGALGWHDDLAKPKWLVEKVLDDHAAWFAEVDGVDIDPSAFTAAHAKEITDALLADFRANQKRDRIIQESHLLDERQFALELVERNEHIYFDGPAGNGKSLPLALAARRLAKQGKHERADAAGGGHRES